MSEQEWAKYLINLTSTTTMKQKKKWALHYVEVRQKYDSLSKKKTNWNMVIELINKSE